MFPKYPRDVEEAGLEEEKEDDPLVVLVGDHLLPRLQWGHTRVRLTEANLVEVTDPVLLPRRAESEKRQKIRIISGYSKTCLDGTEKVEWIQQKRSRGSSGTPSAIHLMGSPKY